MSIRMEIPPNEEIDRVRESRPTDAELALAIAHAVPWNNPVAYTLKLEIEFLRLQVKLIDMTKRNLLRMTALLLGVDAKKTCEALQALERVCELIKDYDEEFIKVARIEAALKGSAL